MQLDGAREDGGWSVQKDKIYGCGTDFLSFDPGDGKHHKFEGSASGIVY
jgi:hypothetical protein